MRCAGWAIRLGARSAPVAVVAGLVVGWVSLKRIMQAVAPAGKRALRAIQKSRQDGFSNLGEQQVLQRYISELNPLRICVDIGANDGRTMSNTYSLFLAGWRGLAVEYDPREFARLSARYSELAEVNLARCMVTPENVVSLLRANRLPTEFGVLSLDIDGYDYFVLRSILSEFRPSIVVTEINEKIPPPIKFTVNYSPSYCWRADHFYGQSISQLDELCRSLNYSLVELEYNNAVLIAGELSPVPALDPAEAYRRGYLNRRDRREKFAWNSDVEHWQTLAPGEALEAIGEYFAERRGEFTISL